MSQKGNARTEWLKQFAFGKPVTFSMLIIIFAGLLTEIPVRGVLEPLAGDRGAKLLQVTIGHTLTGFVLVGLLAKLGLLQDARFTSPRRWKAVWLVWPLVLLSLLNFSSLFDGSLEIDTSRPGLIVLFCFLNLSIGFCEEVMGRGVVLSVMLRKWGTTRRGIYRAALVSGALFGAAHIFNLVTGHLPLLSNLTQIVYSIFFGVFFAACFLRNNSIWPLIIMHTVLDFGGGLRHIAVDGGSQAAVANSTAAGIISALVVTMPLLLYGLFILRKVTPPDQSGDSLEPLGSQTKVIALSG
jgi:CAAX protease family protein